MHDGVTPSIVTGGAGSRRLAAPDSRRAALAQLATTPFDVLVIGGGITGAGVAREAALAGLRTALVEREDFASGTSSRSSRLVHGGVRYLEHGHFSLVFESSRERRVLLDLAPHLVRPLAFTWPVYRGARVPLWKVRAGLLLYDALALFRNERHQRLDRDDVLQQEPALATYGLRGGVRYWDAATDDTRLTLASALGAREAGAVVANHLRVVAGARAGASAALQGVVVCDALTQEHFSVSAEIIINATGPWSDATAALTSGAPPTADVATAGPSQVLGSAGAHIAVPRLRVGNRNAVTMVSPLDGRVMFVLPAGAHAIIGTTERPVRHGPDDVRATAVEVAYLLRSVNALFPHAQLTEDDVVSAWAGIRPLAAARAGEQSANAASREHAITHRSDGLVSVTGGKLTTYRAMAADVLAQALRAPRHHADRPRVSSAQSTVTPLPGGDMTSLAATLQEVRAAVPDSAVAERLATAYGSRWREVWQYAADEATPGERLSAPLPYLMAEVWHAVEHELACTLGDVLIRRLHLAFETRDHGRAAADRIAPRMATLLAWSTAEQQRQRQRYDEEVTRLFTIERP